MRTRGTIAIMITVVIMMATASSAAAQWPVTCVELNDIVEAHLGNDQNVAIYQRVFGTDAEPACRNDHRSDVQSTFGWAVGRPAAVTYGGYFAAADLLGRGWYEARLGGSSSILYLNQSKVFGDLHVHNIDRQAVLALNFSDRRFPCIITSSINRRLTVVHGGDQAHEARATGYCAESVAFSPQATFEIVDAMYRQRTGTYSFIFRDFRDYYSVSVELGDLNNPNHPLTRWLLSGGVDLRHREAWPTSCVELNDIVEAHLANTGNVGIYQRAFGDQAEHGCRTDHRADVQSVFAWAF